MKQNEKIEIGDIIVYSNRSDKSIWFHKILEIKDYSYLVHCLNGDRIERQEGIFDKNQEYYKLNSRYLRLLL